MTIHYAMGFGRLVACLSRRNHRISNIRPHFKSILVAVGLSAFVFGAHALSGEPISGTVVDESTGKPVGNAIVVVHWNGDWTKIVGESSGACYHVETARTDANGRYEIPGWKIPWTLDDLRFSSAGQSYNVYKPGYWRGSNYAAVPKILYVTPFRQTKEAYFETVLGSPSWGCERAGASSKNAYRLFRAMANEAAALAETPIEKSRARMLAKRAEESLVNRDKPTDLDNDHLRNKDARDTFKKEDVPQ
jgi:hypothetical protein